MQKIKIDFNSFKKEKSLNNAKTIYNFETQYGELKSGMGIQSLRVCYDGINEKTFAVNSNIQKILDCYFYDYYDTATNQNNGIFLFYAQKTNNEKAFYYAIYETPMNELVELDNISFSKEPILVKLYVNEKSYMLFIPTKDGDLACLWTNISSATSSNIKASIDACFYDGRIYAIPKANSHRLFITSNQSASTLITSQFNGDYLDFQDGLGNFLALKELNGSLYAIREKGITKITSTNCGENFAYKTITYNFSKIQKNTICVCDDKIFMLGSDAIYVFDGMDFEKLELGIEDLIESRNDSACAVWQNGTYYLALKLKDLTKQSEMPCTGLLNNSLICINDDGAKVLRGVDVKNLMTLNYKNDKKVVMCFDDTNQNLIGEVLLNGAVFGVATQKLYETFDINFSGGLNVIKSLSLSGKGTFEIKIFVDDKCYNYNVLLSKINKKININQKGRKFCFCFKSSSQDAQICDAVLEVL